MILFMFLSTQRFSSYHLARLVFYRYRLQIEHSRTKAQHPDHCYLHQVSQNIPPGQKFTLYERLILMAEQHLHHIKPRVRILDARVGVMRITQPQATVLANVGTNADMLTKLKLGPNVDVGKKRP